jgi:hypothetical protein
MTLAAAGLRASQALAAVLIYRLVGFWLVAGAGWLTFLCCERALPPEPDISRSPPRLATPQTLVQPTSCVRTSLCCCTGQPRAPHTVADLPGRATCPGART